MTAIMETHGDTHVYRPNHGFVKSGRFVVIGFVCVAVLIILAVVTSNAIMSGQPPKYANFMLILPLIFLIIFALSPAAQQNPSLVISPRGIEFHGPGFKLVTDWDNLKKIRMTYKPVLILRRPATIHGVVVLYRFNMSREIPLDIFDFDLYSAIAQDLRTYAPHLFNAEPPRRVRADSDDDDPWL